MFKVGDLIVRNNIPNSNYSITNEDSVCEVIEIIDIDKIRAKIISHKTKQQFIGRSWIVRSKYFELEKPRKKNNYDWR